MPTKKLFLAKNTVTPITAVLFLVSTVTGIMLFFHWQGGLVKASHEWLSLVFSAIAIWHLVRNWSSFTLYFRHNIALSAFVLTLVVSVVFTAMTGRISGSGGSPRMVFMALSATTVERAAPAFGLSIEEAVTRLKLAGYEAKPGETLKTIGKRAGRHSRDVLILLAKKNAK